LLACQKDTRNVGLGAVFERFTERARQVVVLAQDEARALKHNYIGTEHILLGLLREEEGLAARVLESLDITVEEVREQVKRLVGEGDEEIVTGQIPFTPRAKKVLELALREALSLGHSYIGTEHVLLGVVRENQGVAARILLDFDADAETIRNEIFRMLPGPAGPGLMHGAPVQPRAGRIGWTSYGPLAQRAPSLLLGWALGTFSLGVGILIGWAIWGQ
jgi:ATP-dependent Clp protease ATP-binding subunit ClpC